MVVMSSKASLGDALQMYFINKNNSEDHPVLGPLYAHLVGPIVVPVARVADVVKCIFEALGEIFGKVVWGVILLPVNPVRWLCRKDGIQNRFSINRAIESIGKAVIYFVGIPRDMVSNLIDPNWNVTKDDVRQLKTEKNKLEEQLAAKNKEIERLRAQMTRSLPEGQLSLDVIRQDPLNKNAFLSQIRTTTAGTGNLGSSSSNSSQPSASSRPGDIGGSLMERVQLAGTMVQRRRAEYETALSAFEDLAEIIKECKDEQISQETLDHFVNDVLADYSDESEILESNDFPGQHLWRNSQNGNKTHLVQLLNTKISEIQNEIDEIRRSAASIRQANNPVIAESTVERHRREQEEAEARLASQTSTSAPVVPDLVPEDQSPSSPFGVTLKPAGQREQTSNCVTEEPSQLVNPFGVRLRPVL